MVKKLNIYQVDAFAGKAFEGNPAGVTFGDGLTAEEKQAVASEMNLSETAFLSKSDIADYRLQWFTPTTEVEICGHATIACLHFLNETKAFTYFSPGSKDNDNRSVTFETLSGIINCRISGDKYYMQLPVYEMDEFNGDKDEVLNALGLNSAGIDENIPFILLENGYLYIYVKKLDSLKNIAPDFKALKNISVTKKEFFDVTVFSLETVEEGNFAHLRFFAPYYGIDEDPVTGSANGPLLQVLQKLGIIKKSDGEITLTFEQGDFIKRRGRVTVSFNEKKNELFISGNAVTVLKGELSFSTPDIT